MNSMSLCMIVKNEENTLPRCLESVKDLCEEIIIVDTGSSDKTVNDFSHVRNISLSAATKPWIMWLDADDVVPSESWRKIRKIKTDFATDAAFGFQIKNSTDGIMGDAFNQIRIFPNKPDIRFEYRVHEQVLPSIQRLKLKVLYTDIVVVHTGYHSPEALKQKQRRNIVLLKQEIEDMKKDHPVILYMYAGTLKDLGRMEEAAAFYERAYIASTEQQREGHIAEAAPLVLAETGMMTGNTDFYDKWIKIVKKSTPEHIMLFFIEGRMAEKQNNMDIACKKYEKVLLVEERPSFIPIDYKFIKLQACGSLGKLYGTVFHNKKRMVEILEFAMRLQGKEPEPVELIGDRYFAEKNYTKAVSFYKTAVEQNRKLAPQFFERYAKSLIFSGKINEATAVIQKGVEMHEINKELQQLLLDIIP